MTGHEALRLDVLTLMTRLANPDSPDTPAEDREHYRRAAELAGKVKATADWVDLDKVVDEINRLEEGPAVLAMRAAVMVNRKIMSVGKGSEWMRTHKLLFLPPEVLDKPPYLPEPMTPEKALWFPRYLLKERVDNPESKSIHDEDRPIFRLAKQLSDRAKVADDTELDRIIEEAVAQPSGVDLLLIRVLQIANLRTVGRPFIGPFTMKYRELLLSHWGLH